LCYVSFIEADPLNFANILKTRTDAINIQAGVCMEKRLLHYIKSEAVGGFVELMSDDFLRRWFGHLYNNEEAINALPLVPCLPMNSLLQILYIKHVDIWVLDVEGAEFSVLQSTDFNTIHVSFIIMECDGSSIDKDNEKMNYLQQYGFLCKTFKGLGGGGIQNCMCRNSKRFRDRSIYKQQNITELATVGHSKNMLTLLASLGSDKR
jgi:hypothetical protein